MISSKRVTLLQKRFSASFGYKQSQNFPANDARRFDSNKQANFENFDNHENQRPYGNQRNPQSKKPSFANSNGFKGYDNQQSAPVKPSYSNYGKSSAQGGQFNSYSGSNLKGQFNSNYRNSNFNYQSDQLSNRGNSTDPMVDPPLSGQSNYSNNPSNYQNNPSNYQNNSSNYQNNPANYQKNPTNYSNNSTNYSNYQNNSKYQNNLKYQNNQSKYSNAQNGFQMNQTKGNYYNQWQNKNANSGANDYNNQSLNNQSFKKYQKQSFKVDQNKNAEEAQTDGSLYANYSPPPPQNKQQFKPFNRNRGYSPEGKQAAPKVTFPNNELIGNVLKHIGNVEKEAGNYQKAIVFFGAAKKVAGLTTEIQPTEGASEVPGFGSSLQTLVRDLLDTGDSPRSKYAESYAVMFNVLRTLPAFDSEKEWQPISKAVDFSLPQPLTETFLSELPERARLASLGALKYGSNLLKPLSENEVKITNGFLQRCLRAIDAKYESALCGAARRADFDAPASGFVPLLVTHDDFATAPESNEDAAKAYETFLKPLLASLKAYNFVKDVWEENPEELRACTIFQLKSVNNGTNMPDWNPRRLLLRLVPRDAFVANIALMTGDETFWNFLVQSALNSSYSLGPDGLCRWEGRGKSKHKGDPIPLDSEEALFEKLGLRYFSPKERNQSIAGPLNFAIKKAKFYN